MAIKVYPYRVGSRSARALADALEGRVLRKERSKYVRRPGDLIINWGASDCPYDGRGVANQPGAIDAASNKLTFFKRAKEVGVSIPDFWTKVEEVPNDAFPVMCRTKLQSHSGDGIVVANNKDELVRAPLYTKYLKKKDEYRVHVLRKPGGEKSIITIQRKAKRNDAENPNFMIRNLANGFVYIMADGVVPECVLEEAKKSLDATDLAFGAVDVVYNSHENKASVLEVNTAPGLEDRTARAYAEAFREVYREM